MGNSRSHYWQHPVLYSTHHYFLPSTFSHVAAHRGRLPRIKALLPIQCRQHTLQQVAQSLVNLFTASVHVVRDQGSHCGMARRTQQEWASGKLLLGAINVAHGKWRKFGDAFRADTQQSTCSKPKGLESFQSCFAPL